MVIKPINREEHQERLDELQAAISPSILYQILISTPPWMQKWNRKRMESRETRGMVSRQFNLIEIQLECLQMSKNKSFYSNFGRNRPIVLIDGYDETSTMDRFWKSRSRPI